MVSTRLVTADELAAMGSDARFELIEGELIEVSPASFESSFVTAQLTGLLSSYVRASKIGWLTSAEGGIVLRRNPDSVLVPDIAFISKARLPVDQRRHKYLAAAPDLVVEVISPSNTPAETSRKIAIYQAAGVDQIWVVYPEQRAITVHSLLDPPKTLRVGEELDGGDILPGFRVAVSDVFDGPFDE